MFILIFLLLGIALCLSVASIFASIVIIPIFTVAVVFSAGFLLLLYKKSASNKNLLFDRVDGVTVDRDRPEPAEESAGSVPEHKALTREVEETRQQNSALTQAIESKGMVFTQIADLATESSKEAGETVEAAQVAVKNMFEAQNSTEAAIDAVGNTVQRLSGNLADIAREKPSFGVSRAESRDVRRIKELDELISTLEELADQSNVMAINAAIEAARIGQAGRGFAVIAGEMHSFSSQAVELARGFANYGEGEKSRQQDSRSIYGDIREREVHLGRAWGRLEAIVGDIDKAYEEILRAKAKMSIADDLAVLDQASGNIRDLSDKLAAIQTLSGKGVSGQ